MIVSEAEITIMEDKGGNLYFDTEVVDLDKTSLVIPIELEGGMGTMEFKRSVAIIHPPNGRRKIIPARDLVNPSAEDFEGFEDGLEQLDED